ncbi:tetratricopeptide repeat protein [Methyloceanibacter sp.]|uniref:tetratricopeptide repeat protein n=1 Tax=Methyloceanibacter sp. TaxID=1965321 RepID=UPI003D6D8F77
MRFAVVFLIGLTLIGLTAWTVPALADDGDDWPDCNAASVESGIDACTRILQRGEASAADLSVAYNNRGLAYANKGDNDRAIADLSLALSLDPQMVVAYDNRGYAYQNKGEYDRAVADYDEAIRLQSGDAQLYNKRGNAYYGKGDYDLALADYNQALKLKPDFAVVFSNAGNARLNRGEYDRAIADYNKAISFQPNNAAYYDQRSGAHYAKGDYDRAIADATRVIELDPANATAFNSRGSSFIFKGDYERAIADATRAIELRPNSGSDFNNRGRAYLEKGEFSLAIRDLTRAVELIPQSPNPYRHRGVAYLKTGKIDLARADLTRALELKPDYQDAKTALAELEQAEISTKATPPSQSTTTEQAAPEAKVALAIPLPRPSAFPSGKRVALVIGNSDYRSVARLANPANDARLMANALKSLGFELIGGGAQLDLDKAGFDAAVQSFGNQLQGADVGLFYYAGHGLGLRGTNYLVPVNANPSREADLDFQMVDVEVALRQMEASGTKLNVVMLDACRNNPFGGRGLRAGSGGLTQMQAPEGTLISYATQPGNVAQDGTDGDSPYTKALAEIVPRSGLDIFQTFNQVGLAVKKATGGQQQPWLSSSPIEGEFFFAGR